MKVALLCSNFRLGGIQRVAATLANSMAAEGVSVDLVLLRGGGEFVSQLSSLVHVCELDCTSQPLALLLPCSPLASYLKKSFPDVLLSFGNSTNTLAAWAKFLLRAPFRLIVSEHSTFGARMAGDPAFHRWRRILRSKILYKQAESCICVSRGVADDLIDLGIIPQEKAKVIYNPLVGSHLTELAACAVDHPWLQPGQPPVILSVGRLMRLKGLDDLLEAFFLLREKWKVQVRLIFLGEGYYRKALEERSLRLGIANEVCFAGFQENPYAYMSKASAVALASHYEGFANVLAEAMACGTNVVSTDCRSGPSEILENGKWGSLVPIGDFEAMAEALRNALTSPLPAEKLKNSAKRFSVESSVSSYMKVLKNS